MESLVPIIAIVSIVTIVTLVVTLAIKAERRRIERKTNELAGMGLFPLDPPDPIIVAEIVRLQNASSSERLGVRHMYSRDRPGGKVYVFDLWGRSGKSNAIVAENAVAIVSSRLGLPRLSLYPRAPSDGFLGRMTNSLAEKLLRKKSALIDYSGEPSIGQRYLVAGSDPAAVRKALTSDVISRLGKMEGIHVEGEGTMLLMHYTRRQRVQGPEGGDPTGELLHFASGLAESLEH